VSQSCESCRYFDGSPGEPVGRCRQVPPWVTESGTQWPEVGRLDWCGGYKAKPARSVQQVQQPAKEEEETISVPEAGRRFLGLTPASSYQAARRGDIPTFKIGTRVRVPLSAFRERIEKAKR
jgi:hypothetical protein